MHDEFKRLCNPFNDSGQGFEQPLILGVVNEKTVGVCLVH